MNTAIQVPSGFTGTIASETLPAHSSLTETVGVPAGDLGSPGQSVAVPLMEMEDGREPGLPVPTTDLMVI